MRYMRNDRDYNWQHNAALGRVMRAKSFLNDLQNSASLTDDAQHWLFKALSALGMAAQEIKMRRKEQDGTDTQLYTIENGEYVKVKAKRVRKSK